MTKRNKKMAEFVLRKQVQKIIGTLYERYNSQQHQESQEVLAERQLRKIIKTLIVEAFTLKEVTIDIEDDFVMKTDEEEREEEEKQKEQDNLSDEEKAVESEIDLEREEQTGTKQAIVALKQISSAITDAYSTLGDERDRQYFYDWLFINILLNLHGREELLNPGEADAVIPEEFLSVIERYTAKADEDDDEIDEPGTEPTNHPTGIHFVGRVYKQIEPQYGPYFSELTTDVAQRKSFIRALIAGIRNLLDPQRVLRVIEKETASRF
jgi:hypothetical protein